MKVKLTAGAELDMITADEVRRELRAWHTEVTRGAKFRRRSLAGAVNGAGELLITDDGPGEGFVWAITRLSVAAGLAADQSVSVYMNDANPSSLVWSGLVDNATPGDHGIVVTSGESLVIAGTGLTAGWAVVVTATIKEVPALMAWSL